ncbi:Nodulation protein D 2 [Serratia entomophila]|uniref:LysR family transcriptional regulator n=1 Tax=Serratia entomophila TaxID=42906 RepID=UPI0021798A51|nr:LysR family transcriptional regulator [Serratia entomophila]CAI1579210.1 Nodulation protein D 2 [Serratia entomophila]CAI2923182.1 Nodulation protein D 2 [Serratia entomophila]
MNTRQSLETAPLTSASVSGGLMQWISVARSHELNAVATLRLLLETCNLSETARQLNTSQSAVSRTLERMRRELGDPLLLKSANRMLRSKRADTLLSVLDEILSANYRLYRESIMFDPAREVRSFVIGMSDSTQSIIANDLFSTIRAEAPQFMIRMEPALVENASSLLTHGRLDLVVGFWPTDFGDFRTETFAQGDLVCLASKDNPLIRRSMSLTQLAQQAFVEVNPGGIGFIGGQIDDLFTQQGLVRHKVAILSSYLAVPWAIAATDLFCFVPRLLLPQMLQHDRVAVVELGFTSPRYAMTMCWHNIAHTDPGQVWLRQKIGQALRAAASRANMTASRHTG